MVAVLRTGAFDEDNKSTLRKSSYTFDDGDHVPSFELQKTVNPSNLRKMSLDNRSSFKN